MTPIPFIRSGIAALAAGMLACAAAAQPRAPAKSDIPVLIPKKLEGGSRFSIRVSPFLDLRFLVRAVNTGRAPAPPIEGFEKALAADKTVMESLPGLASGVFESNFLSCPDAQEARSRAATLEERASFPGLKMVNLRTLGTDLADSLAAIEPAFLAQVWPEHRKLLDEAKASLEPSLIAKQSECVRTLAQGVGVEDPAVEIVVYLITHGPAPGSYTFRAGVGSACVIAVGPESAGTEPLTGSAVAEAVLYQSVYALSSSVPNPQSVPLVLRKAVKDAKLPASDCGTRELPRALNYALASATVRAVLDPAHVDLAERRQIFRDCPRAWEAAKSAWSSVVNGSMAGPDAARAAVEMYLKVDSPAPNDQKRPASGGK